MAKALLGHLGNDPRVVSKVMTDNRLLRQRVADLEAHVLRLQADNDRLAVAAAEHEMRTFDDSMQPA